MRKHDNSDYMSRRMDKELKRLEEEITALYEQVEHDLIVEFEKYTEKITPQILALQNALEMGEITETEYQLLVRSKILSTKMYKEAINLFADMLVKADVAAMALTRGELPYVIASSYNFIESLGWKAADDAGLSVGTFQIFNAEAVQKLIRDNPRLLPYVDLPADQQWNMQKINNTITHAITKGDKMDDIAKQLQNVANMDNNTAIRTARTAFTYAENLGRDEAYHDLKKKGIPVKKMWSAVLDNRTRETHRLLNGTFANENDLFGEGILDVLLRCPADPMGEPQEIYNCRCRESIVFTESLVDHSNDDDLYEKFMKEHDAKSYEALKDRNYFAQHRIKGH